MVRIVRRYGYNFLEVDSSKYTFKNNRYAFISKKDLYKHKK